MVKFTALQNAKVTDSKAPNVTKDVSIEVKILALLKENVSVTTTEMARRLFANRHTVQRGLDVLKGNGRAMRIWLDLIFYQELNVVIDWSKIDKEDYLLAMERSLIKDIEIKYLLKIALTDNSFRRYR